MVLESKTKVLAGLVIPRASPLGLWMAASSLFFHWLLPLVYGRLPLRCLSMGFSPWFVDGCLFSVFLWASPLGLWTAASSLSFCGLLPLVCGRLPLRFLSVGFSPWFVDGCLFTVFPLCVSTPGASPCESKSPLAIRTQLG